MHTDSTPIHGSPPLAGGRERLRPEAAGLASPGSGLAVPGLDVFRRNPDLTLVALLLVAIAIGSRGFTQAIQIGPLYVTEIMLGLAGLIALVRLGAAQSWIALRRLPLLALSVIWVAGVIATIRGLRDYSFALVEDDIGLLDYSLVLPLLALVLADRERYEAMFATLVASGFVGIATFALTFVADQLAGDADSLIALQGQAAGLYMALAITWIFARIVHGVPTPRWLLALAPAGVLLMALTTQRSVWIIALFSLGAVVVLAPRAARLRSGLALGATLLVAAVAAVGIQAGLNATLGGVEDRTLTTTDADDDEAGRDDPQLIREIGGLGGGDTAEADNVTWRIAYWEELLSRVPEQPVLGAGFGEPAAFVWSGRKYDFRDGEPGAGIDVAGPHNSFVAWVYRLGIPAALALLFALFVAARNVLRELRRDELEVGDRVALVTLVGMLGAGIGVSLFNESLNGPFLGLFFWVPLAMLLLWPAVRGVSGSATSRPAP